MSVWWTTKPAYEPLPPLEGTIAADIAVIGGGLTGVSSALHLKKRFPEKNIVLLEATHIAAGASGRNGGLLLNWVNGVHPHDATHAKRIYDATSMGIDLAGSLVREYGLDVPLRRDGCLEVYTSDDRAAAARDDVRALNAVGVPVRYLEGEELTGLLDLAGVKGAVLDPSAGQIDTSALLRGLRPVLVDLGVGVYEGTPAVSVEQGEQLTVRTPGGEVRAQALVLGTNVYSRELGFFRDGIVPVHSHVIATEPLSMAEWKEIGWGGIAGFSDDLDRITYACLTPSGRLVIGGGSNAAYGYQFGGPTRFEGSAEASFAAIHRRLLDYLPRAASVKITHRWTGAVALTLSRRCTMGVTGQKRNIYYALGYSGHGIALAILAGRCLSDAYAGTDDVWRDLPFYEEKLRYVPPEPFRWIGYHVYSKLTGKSPRSV